MLSLPKTMIGLAFTAAGALCACDNFVTIEDETDLGGNGQGAVVGDSGGSDAAGAGGAQNTVGGAGGQAATGPMVTIRFRALTDPFDHQDGLAGQTPLSHSSGLRKLELFKDENDDDPFTVFDFGDDYVEVGYNHGDDTVVYTMPVDQLPWGTYTIARVVHTHVRYQVAATMHASMTLPGQFDNMQVLSDHTIIDGTVRDHGYFEYVFNSGSLSFPTSGSNAPTPVWTTTGGFTASFENGEWAYTFPVNLPLNPTVGSDITVVLEVNMFQSFRWQDQEQGGFQQGVFDTTPLSFEPVMHFGANDFHVLLE